MRLRPFRLPETREVDARLRSRFGGLIFSVRDQRVAGVSVVSVFATAPRFGSRTTITAPEAEDIARQIYEVAQQASQREVRVRVLADDSSVHDYCPMHLGSALVTDLVNAFETSPLRQLDEESPDATGALRLTVAFSGDATAAVKLAGDRPAEEQLVQVASLYVGCISWLLGRYPDAASTSALLAYAEWAAGQLERAARVANRSDTATAFLQALDYAPARTAPAEVEVTVWASGVRCPRTREAEYLPLTLCLFTRALCSPQMPPFVAAETASALRRLLDSRRGPLDAE